MDTQSAARHDAWASGENYEPYVGRWSRHLARNFVTWLDASTGHHWLDVGCGTGALTQAILDIASPATVRGVDRSEGFVTYAQMQVQDARARFEVGDAQALPVEDASCDLAVSGLVLNFVPNPVQMIAEMRRVVRPGGTVALYIWDYASKMQFMRHFWNAAAALDPAAYALDEGRRFPLCQPQPLATLFRETELTQVAVRPIDIDTDFKNFDDFWLPFLGGQGSAPGYAMSLTEAHRNALRDRIREQLPTAIDGSIPLVARAWAVRGVREARAIEGNIISPAETPSPSGNQSA